MAQETAENTTADDSAADAAGGDEATDEMREGLVATFRDALGDNVRGSHIDPGHEVWIRVHRDAWTAAAELAKSSLGCTFFDFLSAIDWLPSPWGRYEDAALPSAGGSGLRMPDPAAPVETGYAGGDTRFQVLCRVANIYEHHSVILKADLPGIEPGPELSIASLVPIYLGADWQERECWEMFGITFDGHPDLRHVYLPGDFEGYPLRKDFPLAARLVKPWPGIVDVETMPEAPVEPDAPEGGDE
jgi:NADH-quinone oxidoreductase subunit C